MNTQPFSQTGQMIELFVSTYLYGAFDTTQSFGQFGFMIQYSFMN